MARSAIAVLVLIGALAGPFCGGADAQALDASPPAGAGVLGAIEIGFMRHAYGTWTARIGDGGFLRTTGRTMRWHPAESDSVVMSKLVGGRLDIGIVGTSVLSAALQRGLDLRAFYVLGSSPECEGLVLEVGSIFRFSEPGSLQRMVIAAPFGSSAHYRLLHSLKHWGLSPASMKIVNLQATQIAMAWERRHIDAAVASEPLLGQLA